MFCRPYLRLKCSWELPGYAWDGHYARLRKLATTPALFSPSVCPIAMFSRASIAIAFRRWRRNILDKAYQSAIPPIRHHQGLRSGRESLPLMIWIIRPVDKQADGFPVLVGISVKDSLSGYFPFPYYTSKKNSTSIRMDSWSLNTV